MPWSDEQRQEVLRAYYGEGLSARQVAGRYGVSRQAVIGIVHRYSAQYGYERKGRPEKKRQSLPKPAKRRRAPSPRTAQAWTPQTAPTAPRLPRPSPAILPSLEMTFDDLGTTRCQFATTPHDVPPAGHRFCGHPVESGRWCAHHARLIRNPRHREDDHG